MLDEENSQRLKNTKKKLYPLLGPEARQHFMVEMWQNKMLTSWPRSKREDKEGARAQFPLGPATTDLKISL